MQIKAELSKEPETPSSGANKSKQNQLEIKKRPTFRTTNIRKLMDIILNNPDSINHDEFILFQKQIGYRQSMALIQEGNKRKREKEADGIGSKAIQVGSQSNTLPLKESSKTNLGENQGNVVQKVTTKKDPYEANITVLYKGDKYITLYSDDKFGIEEKEKDRWSKTSSKKGILVYSKKGTYVVCSNTGELSYYLNDYKNWSTSPMTAPKETNSVGDKKPIGSTSEFKEKHGETIIQQAKELGIKPNMLAAVILVESGGSGYVDGKLKIRFENHYFLDRTKEYTDLFTYPWTNHKFRKSKNEEWKKVHTGKQSSEYEAFDFAKSLDEDPAYQSISMGFGQIMGANFKDVGYNSAKGMYKDFSRGHEQQIKGMVTFFKNYNNGATLKALQKGDLKTFVSQYNGPGQVSTYTKLINQRVEEYENTK